MDCGDEPIIGGKIEKTSHDTVLKQERDKFYIIREYSLSKKSSIWSEEHYGQSKFGPKKSPKSAKNEQPKLSYFRLNFKINIKTDELIKFRNSFIKKSPSKVILFRNEHKHKQIKLIM